MLDLALNTIQESLIDTLSINIPVESTVYSELPLYIVIINDLLSQFNKRKKHVFVHCLLDINNKKII